MTESLRTELGFDDPDEVYETLIHMHDGLDDAQSQVVNARLILILANHIGDRDILGEAIALARGDRT